jgi:hypothetical protein
MQTIINAKEVRKNNVVVFYYNDDLRCVAVEKITDTYIQGRCLPFDGALPKREFGTFNVAKIVGTIKLESRSFDNSEYKQFNFSQDTVDSLGNRRYSY